VLLGLLQLGHRLSFFVLLAAESGQAGARRRHFIERGR